jgi:hypothetical protein
MQSWNVLWSKHKIDEIFTKSDILNIKLKIHISFSNP